MPIKAHVACPAAVGWMPFSTSRGEHSLAVIAKTSLALTAADRLEPIAPADQPSLTGDRYAEDDRAASCLYASDFVPFKPRGEITFEGSGHAAGGAPVTELDVSFGLADAVKTLRVFGDRHWVIDRSGRHRPSEPDPFVSMPLVYEKAFGGPAYDLNPAGIGYRGGAVIGGRDKRTALPNVEDPRNLLRTPRDMRYPAGFAPINAAWKERRDHVGSYGPDYFKNHWPSVPPDFNWAYYCAAPRNQRASGFYRGDETIVADNLHPRYPKIRAPLPGIRQRCFALIREEDGFGMQEVQMNLDSIHVDLNAETVSLVWRGSLPVSSLQAPEVARLFLEAEPVSQPARPVEDYLARIGEMLAAERAASEPPPMPEPAAPPAPEAPEDPDPALADLQARIDQELEAVKQQLRNADLPEPAKQEALDERDPERFLDKLLALVQPAETDAAASAAQRKERDKALLAEYGFDTAIVDEVDPETRKEGQPEGDAPWTRERVVAHHRSGGGFEQQDLRGLDLAGLDLAAGRFDQALMTNCDLTGTVLTGASLDTTQLSGAVLDRADLSRTVLDSADLSDVSAIAAAFRQCQAVGATFQKAGLAKADFTGAVLTGALFIGVDLTSAVLDGVSAAKSVFEGATLDRTRIRAADLTHASFTKASGEAADFTRSTGTRLQAVQCRLPGAVFTDATLDYATFKGSDLANATFSFSSMIRVDLSGATLTGGHLDAIDFTTGLAVAAGLEGASIRLAQLYRASFFQANLRKARFTRSCLIEAELLEADLHGAALDGADLARTRLADYAQALGGADA